MAQDGQEGNGYGVTAVRDSAAAVSQEDDSKTDSSGAEVICAGCCSGVRD